MDKIVDTKSPITRHSSGLDSIDLNLLEALLSGQSVMNHALQSGQPRSKLYVRMGKPAFQTAMRDALEARRAEVLGQYASLVWVPNLQKRQGEGLSLRGIAARLEEMGHLTRTGKRFQAVQIQRLLM